MTLRQILEHSIEKYAQQPSGTSAWGGAPAGPGGSAKPMATASGNPSAWGSAPAGPGGSNPSNAYHPIRNPHPAQPNPKSQPPSAFAQFGRDYANFAQQNLNAAGRAAGQAGRAIWNNGGEQAWNYGGKQTASALGNTFHGLGTTAVGAANAAAGTIGALGGGIGYLGAGVTDATGLTRGAQDWIGDKVMRPTTRAIGAGLTDVVGGAADTISGGNYDYDGTFAAPGQHRGTYVEQMRSDMRNELGRGSDMDRAFNVTNAVADFAANQAAIGGFGRGINVAAKTMQGSQTAAPVLNAAASTPVVGRPMAAAGRWLAGPAPAANMFQQTPAQYYRTMGGPLGYLDDGLNLRAAITDSTNPADRPQEFRQHVEGAYPTQSVFNQERRSDGTDYAMTDAMLNDPAIKNRMGHGALPADVATQLAQQSGVVPAEDQAAAAEAMSSNAPQVPPEPAAPNVAAAAGTTQNPEPVAAPPAAQPAQAAATAPDDPFGDLSETLKTAPAETKQQIEQQTVVPAVVEQIKPNITPEKTEAATLVATKPGTPEAEAAAAPARDQFITDQAGGDPAKTQDPNWYGKAVGMWDNMGPMGQAAFMIGVPAALIGLLSGDGLSGILGGLGIGLLGMGAGAMGMMGAGTQRSMGQLMGQLGSAMGYNVERDANNLMPGSEASKKFETELAAAFQKSPAEAQKMLDARTAQFQPLEQLHSINPELAHSYLMGMENGPATSEEAAKLYQQLAGQVAEARDPNFLRNQAVTRATDMVRQGQNLVPPLVRMGARFGKDLIPGAKAILPESVQQLIDNASTDPRVVAEREIEKRYKTSADMNIAQKIIAKHMLKKASRCWAGYEPVPGKKPYSNDSCRPVGSKKKKQTGKERHHETTKQGGAQS